MISNIPRVGYPNLSPRADLTISPRGNIGAVLVDVSNGQRVVAFVGKLLAVDSRRDTAWPRLLVHDQGRLRVKDVSSGSAVIEVEGPTLAAPAQARWATGRRCVLTQGEHGELRWWDIDTGATQVVGTSTSRVIALSPDGNTVAAAGRTGLTVWSLAAGGGASWTVATSSQPTALLALDTGQAVIGLICGSVYLAGAGRVRPLGRPARLGLSVRSLTARSDSSVTVHRVDDSLDELVLPNPGSAWGTLPEEDPAPLTPPEPWRVGADPEGNLQVRGPVGWDHSLLIPERKLTDTQVRGDYAALRFADEEVEVMHLPTGDAAALPADFRKPSAFAWHPSQPWLALAVKHDDWNADNVLLWDAAAGQPRFTTTIENEPSSLAFSADSNVLTFGQYKQVTLVDSTSGAPRMSVPTAVETVDVVAGPDDQGMLVAASSEATGIEAFDHTGRLLWRATGIDFGSAEVTLGAHAVSVRARDGRVHSFDARDGTPGPVDGVSTHREDTDVESAVIEQLRSLIAVVVSGNRAGIRNAVEALRAPLRVTSLPSFKSTNTAWIELEFDGVLGDVPFERAFGRGEVTRVYDMKVDARTYTGAWDAPGRRIDVFVKYFPQRTYISVSVRARLQARRNTPKQPLSRHRYPVGGCIRTPVQRLRITPMKKRVRSFL